QVPETVCIFTCELRPIREHESLAHERGQARTDLQLLGSKSLQGAAVEDLSLDRGTLQRGLLSRIQLIQTRGQQRLNGRWHEYIAVRSLGCKRGPFAAVLQNHVDHHAHEEGIPSGCTLDSLAKVILELARDEAIHVFLREGLQAQRNRPRRMPFDEL